MKKFLSIFVAVAMVFSLFAGTFAPRAAAAVGFTLGDSAKKTTATAPKYYYNSFPSPLALQPFATGTRVYKMGDSIHGTVVFDATVAGQRYITQLLAWNGSAWATVIDSVNAFQSTTQATGSATEALKTYPIQIGTGNVSYDGPYIVRVFEDLDNDGVQETGDEIFDSVVVYIQYNLVLKTSLIGNCDGFNTIEGWITRGNGQTVLFPVIVCITYPDNSIAAYYTVAPLSSGQFSLTFSVDVPTQIGDFGLFVRDAYAGAAYPLVALPNVTAEAPASGDNDAMVYEWLSNVPENLALTAATYYSPVLLYEAVCDQMLVLQLTDQDGNYVSGATWSVLNADSSVSEISPGFYQFNLDIGSVATDDVRFTASYDFFGTQHVHSNTLILPLRQLGAFNPYLYVDADNSRSAYLDCNVARYVYDKLPCTIGNGLEVVVGLYPPADPDNWYVYDWEYEVLGPIRDLTDDEPHMDGQFEAHYAFVIEEAGKITANISATIWERIGKCPEWFTGTGWTSVEEKTGCEDWHGGEWIAESLMELDACCHTYSKSFEICEVTSCALVSVTLENGAQTDASSILVNKKADLVVNVSGANAPAGLSCGCNTKIVRIYMTSNCGIIADAFTVDTYAGTTSTVGELWYNGITDAAGRTSADYTWNPQKYTTAGLPLGVNGTVTFAATTPNAIIVDNCEKLTFKGVKFNYVNTGIACDYQLVVEVFGLERAFDACGNMTVSYPFISETLNDIDINPVITTLSATGNVFEGAIDPVDILAGVAGTYIETTDPKFTLADPTWKVTLNTHKVPVTVTSIEGGYKFNFSCAFWEPGTLTIYGYAEGAKCATKEVVTITKTVVMPTFEVKIGLLNGKLIANDHIITKGFEEDIYVTATDPRADGTHDFSAILDWDLEVDAVYNDCGLPTSMVWGCTPTGCTTPSPISVFGIDNPNIEDAPQFELYFVVGDCAYLYVDTFTLADPSVTVSPTEVPFTIPATATHVVFTVKDAHGFGAPDVSVSIEGAIVGTAGASGYNFVAGEALTDDNGEADWAFVPPYSGKYYVYVENYFTSSCVPFGPALTENSLNLNGFGYMCGWGTASMRAAITAKYQAPVVDTTAPVVTITAGIDGSKVSASTLNLTGKVTDNVGVTQLYVGFNKVDVLPDGSFMAALKLAEGENTIAVVAYDAAGNKGTATAKVTYTAPVDTSIVLVLTIGADIVSVNGKATSIDAAPEIVASRTFVPLRFIAEAFGATVEWLPETQGITITLGEHTVGLQIGNATAVVDGTIISLPAAPYIKNGRTMVPLRLISEAFGGDVVWDAATRTITITYQP
jgi:hypothetical protein